MGKIGVRVQDGTLPPTSQVALGDISISSTRGSLSWTSSQRASPDTALEGPHAQHQQGPDQMLPVVRDIPGEGGCTHTFPGRTLGMGREQECPGTGTRQALSSRITGCLPTPDISLGLQPGATEGAQWEAGRILGKLWGQLYKAPDGWVLVPTPACLPTLHSSISVSREPLSARAPAPGSAPDPCLHRVLLS